MKIKLFLLQLQQQQCSFLPLDGILPLVSALAKYTYIDDNNNNNENYVILTGIH